MTDDSDSISGRKPVAELPQAHSQRDLYQTRTILERQLSLAQHKDKQAVAILERALALVEHISCGEKSTRLLPTAADHIRSALALLDN
ncbi:MAG: hypothetical protein KDK04_09095 [Candidatus Competibacteraceae bacterium]|nr:hypothetical protein [Candidatus Competibacteraceae bacterium]MCB1803923.1 hypothetical protein [Candidatus Competibacteraceae bacterium]MCB1811857.1 hypothetical protein [Candidatus Competibacteraceae bacterium]